MADAHATREQWLLAAIEALRPTFAAHGYTVPVAIRVSCGFPLGSRKAVGQAWSRDASADKTAEIFVTPAEGKAVEVIDTLVHELVHVTVGNEHGHKGEFKKCALKVGLAGKMKSCGAGPELKAKLVELCNALGPYPHAALSPSGSPRKVQGTRMRKLECPACGYTARTTGRWIRVGLPFCACGCEMEVASA